METQWDILHTICTAYLREVREFMSVQAWHTCTHTDMWWISTIIMMKLHAVLVNHCVRLCAKPLNPLTRDCDAQLRTAKGFCFGKILLASWKPSGRELGTGTAATQCASGWLAQFHDRGCILMYNVRYIAWCTTIIYSIMFIFAAFYGLLVEVSSMGLPRISQLALATTQLQHSVTMSWDCVFIFVYLYCCIGH